MCGHVVVVGCGLCHHVTTAVCRLLWWAISMCHHHAGLSGHMGALLLCCHHCTGVGVGRLCDWSWSQQGGCMAVSWSQQGGCMAVSLQTCGGYVVVLPPVRRGLALKSSWHRGSSHVVIVMWGLCGHIGIVVMQGQGACIVIAVPEPWAHIVVGVVVWLCAHVVVS